MIACGEYVHLCVYVVHHSQTVTLCYCVTTIISIAPVVPIVFTNKVQKLLNCTDLMNMIQTALIPIEIRSLLEVDYAIGYETYKKSLCPTSLTLSLNVVSLEPFWYPIETDQFRTQYCLLVITCGDHVRLCVSVIHHCQTLTHCYCVTTII